MRIEKKMEEEGQHKRDFFRRRSRNFQKDEQILLWGGGTPLKTRVVAWERRRRDNEEGNHLRIFEASTCAMGGERMPSYLSLNNNAHQI